MSAKRRIVVADLDAPIRSIVNECLPSDHFDIAEFDENASVASTAHVDLVIFCAPKDVGADSGTLRDASVPHRRECPVVVLRRSVRLPSHQAASWQRRAEYDHYAV